MSQGQFSCGEGDYGFNSMTFLTATYALLTTKMRRATMSGRTMQECIRPTRPRNSPWGVPLPLFEEYARYAQIAPEPECERASVGPGISNLLSESEIPASTAELRTDTEYDKKCEICSGSFRNIWHCNVCKCLYCDNCWNSQLLHRRTARNGQGHIPHEKTDPTVAEKVGAVMFPPEDERTREQLHRDDAKTSWFGMFVVCFHNRDV